MPVTCHTVDAPTLVLYRFIDKWEAPELVERRRELVRAGQLTPKSAVLFDLRQSTGVPSLTDLHHTVSDEVWPACRAFLVTTEEQHGLARQLQALLGPRAVVNAVFHDETKAMEWLAAMAGRAHAIR
jgi:hypothetical protein